MKKYFMQPNIWYNKYKMTKKRNLEHSEPVHKLITKINEAMELGDNSISILWYVPLEAQFFVIDLLKKEGYGVLAPRDSNGNMIRIAWSTNLQMPPLDETPIPNVNDYYRLKY